MGTIIQSGASNTDGTAVSLITLTHDAELVTVALNASNVSGADTSGLLDILIDPAGGTSWATNPLIPDLLAGFMNVVNVVEHQGFAARYTFPIWVPSGAALGARWRSKRASTNLTVNITAQGGNAHPGSWWCGQNVTAIGINAGTSSGTAHAPATAPSYSSWASLGSTLAQDAKYFVLAVGGTDASMVGTASFFELGISSARIVPPFWKLTQTFENAAGECVGLPFYSAPAGSQLQVRGSSGGAETFDLAAYAVS